MKVRQTRKANTVSNTVSKKTPRAAKPRRASTARSSAGKYEEIRLDLERQRSALLEEAALLMNRSDLESFPDLSDQATAEVDQSFVIRLKEREQKLLKKIEEALERIGAKTYAICERCGEEIPYQRLKVRPVTTYCVQCKTLQEEQEKIRGEPYPPGRQHSPWEHAGASSSEPHPTYEELSH